MRERCRGCGVTFIGGGNGPAQSWIQRWADHTWECESLAALIATETEIVLPQVVDAE